MFELGQPLHAFDAATADDAASSASRPRGDGEKFTTLDGIERTLVKTDLVIRDGERGIALAGVMGGARHRGHRRHDARAARERELRRRCSVRRTARRLGLHSEASHRFERGVDPELAALASARAARLLCVLGGGKVVGDAVDAYPGKRDVAPIAVRLPRVQMLTGVAARRATTCRDALERLGFTVDGDRRRARRSRRRRARADVTREVDVIEEILRITGYEQVPSTLPALRQAPPMRPARSRRCSRGARSPPPVRPRRSRTASSRPSAAARSACRRPIAARSRSRCATR